MKKPYPVKLISVLLITFGLASGCAATDSKSSGSSADATKAIEAADDAIAEAKANDWIWRDTEKFLDQAKEAAASGDYAKATQLADKAKFQAEMAASQHKEETTNLRYKLFF